MKVSPTGTRLAAALASLCALTAFGAAPALADDDGGRDAGRVYTLTNQATGNAVAVFDRAPATGALTPAGTVPTGGLGTGAGLGNQGAIAQTDDDRLVLAVNAGSDTVSVLRERQQGLGVTDIVPSGGDRPISVTVEGRLVYVLNAGDGSTRPASISGFRLAPNGHIAPLAGSTRSLSGPNVGPAQIGFDPSGRTLTVTEKGTNLITTFAVGRDGRPGGPLPQASSGQTPFGFAFDRRGHLIVSEAFGGTASALSSYDVARSGTLSLVSGSVPATGQRAACWVVVTRDGRFTYTTNAATRTVSGYRIGAGGSLSLLARPGLPAATQSAPTDAALSDGDRFLYVLNGEQISGFAVAGDGDLTPLPDGGASGLPAGTNGLAAN